MFRVTIAMKNWHIIAILRYLAQIGRICQLKTSKNAGGWTNSTLKLKYANFVPIFSDSYLMSGARTCQGTYHLLLWPVTPLS